MVNRVKMPKISIIKRVELLRPQEYILDNGIKLYSLSLSSQDIIKINFVFDAGKYYQMKSLTANLTVEMLKEGTKNYSSIEIANLIDYYGAFLELNSDFDFAEISLYSLNKYIDKLIPVLADIIKYPMFFDNEFEVLLRNKYNAYKVNNQKVMFIARQNFSKILFGDKHPYGMGESEESYKDILRNDIVEFYKKQYTYKNCRIYLSGKVNDDIVKLLNNHFGDKWGEGFQLNKDLKYKINPSDNKRHIINVPNVIQSAIRIGKITIDRRDADFHKLSIVTTILGGYFGSRLQKNIREEKGYTYGIGSVLIPARYHSLFIISSEVISEKSRLAVEEVYNEIEKLCNKEVSKEELERVKNYISGQILKSIDGPFAMMNIIKIIKEYELSDSYYDNYLETVNNIKPIDIIETAKKYIDINSLYELIVGR